MSLDRNVRIVTTNIKIELRIVIGIKIGLSHAHGPLTSVSVTMTATVTEIMTVTVVAETVITQLFCILMMMIGTLTAEGITVLNLLTLFFLPLY